MGELLVLSKDFFFVTFVELVQVENVIEGPVILGLQVSV